MTPEEFKEIFNQHHWGMMRLATSIVGSFFAEDIVQDSMLELWYRRNESHKSIQGFLFTCIHNKGYNHLKSKYRREKIDNDLKYLEDVSIDYINFQMERGECIGRILNAVNALPKDRKKVMKLWYGGFSPKEISEELKISESTVNVQVKKFIDGFEKKNKSSGRPDKIVTYNGESKSLRQWAEQLYIPKATLWQRLKKGIPVEIAFKKDMQLSK